MKNIGKPCAVAPHARFDEEGLVRSTMEWLLRHRQTKEAETDRLILMLIGTNSLLYLKVLDNERLKQIVVYFIDMGVVVISTTKTV